MKTLLLLLAAQSIEPDCAWTLTLREVPEAALPHAKTYQNCLARAVDVGVSASGRIGKCSEVRSQELIKAEHSVSPTKRPKVRDAFVWLDRMQDEQDRCGTNLYLRD